MSDAEALRIALYVIGVLVVSLVGWYARTIKEELRGLKAGFSGLNEKLDELLEKYAIHDVRFAGLDARCSQNETDIRDLRASLHKSWAVIRKFEMFARLIKTVHNKNHPDNKINGLD